MNSAYSYRYVAGGQGFTMKLRQTAERSPGSMLLEPPIQINGSSVDTPKWRHLKYVYFPLKKLHSHLTHNNRHAFGMNKFCSLVYTTYLILLRRREPK